MSNCVSSECMSPKARHQRGRNGAPTQLRSQGRCSTAEARRRGLAGGLAFSLSTGRTRRPHPGKWWLALRGLALQGCRPTAPARILNHTSTILVASVGLGFCIRRLDMRSVGPPCPFVLPRVCCLLTPSAPPDSALQRSIPTRGRSIPSRSTVVFLTLLRLFVLGSTFSVFLCALLSFSASPHASPSTHSETREHHHHPSE
jgi:hypothetical protein